MSSGIGRKIVVTAGGSGGHVTVAMAVMDEMFSRGIKKEDVIFVGGDLAKEGDTSGKSIEEIMIEKTGVSFQKIRVGKLQRYLNFQTIRLLFRTIFGFWDSLVFLWGSKPRFVLSFGGYVSVPVCVVARLLGCKVFLHEQTAAVGLSNKIVSWFATTVFVNFPSSKKFFPNKQVVHVGNPLRRLLFDRNALSGEIGRQLTNLVYNARAEEIPIVYVTGGGQGAMLFNNVVINNLELLLSKYAIILQAGTYQYSQNISKVKKLFTEGTLKKYIDRFMISDVYLEEIGYILQNCDVVVTRAGAGTITELGALKKRSVLVPIKWVTHGEQFKNAKILSDIGLGKILDEDKLSVDMLNDAIVEILNKDDPSLELAERTFPTNADVKIVDYLVDMKFLPELVEPVNIIA